MDAPDLDAPGFDVSAIDAHWIRCALALAEQGVGLASPNPTVGCVLVRGNAEGSPGQIVGRGFHQYDHRDHAEIVALKHAGGLARGSTAYVTLEPCSHYGRTGPCAKALVAAGVTRAVIATADPNPAVHGRGIDILKAAGVQVTLGVLQAEARALNDAFARFIRTRLPFVTLKIAATLDGRIAEANQFPGKPLTITGPAAREEVQQLRHRNDALLTTINTVLADDPLLTDRSHRSRRRPLLRVVLDSSLRLPLTSRLVKSANQGAGQDVAVFTRSNDESKRRALTDRGVQVFQTDAQAEGGLSLQAVLGKLGEQNITSVLFEGGARLNRSALLSDAVDRLILFYAPTFLGAEALSLLAPGPPTRWPRILTYALHQFGPDFAFEGTLRDSWS